MIMVFIKIKWRYNHKITKMINDDNYDGGDDQWW